MNESIDQMLYIDEKNKYMLINKRLDKFITKPLFMKSNLIDDTNNCKTTTYCVVGGHGVKEYRCSL